MKCTFELVFVGIKFQVLIVGKNTYLNYNLYYVK